MYTDCYLYICRTVLFYRDLLMRVVSQNFWLGKYAVRNVCLKGLQKRCCFSFQTESTRSSLKLDGLGGAKSPRHNSS